MNDLRIVLIEPTHPGNIGAAARAMKTMGVAELHLIRPLRFPDPEADARAAGAVDILERARVHEELAPAIADAGLILGTSARSRRLAWPELDPRQAAAEARQASDQGNRVALLFGRERSGLTNQEVQRCHRLVRIPTDPEYGSLNLAAAVQVLCYEWLMAGVPQASTEAAGSVGEPASGEELEGLFGHLEQVMTEVGFLDPDQPGHVMARMRRLMLRAHPDRIEVNILRGLLRAVQERRAGSGR